MKVLIKFLLLNLVIGCVLADTSIYLSKSQLEFTQTQIKTSGNLALQDKDKAESTLSAIKLESLNLTEVESEIKIAQPIFKHSVPLSTKLANGQKYYLYSKSLVKINQAGYTPDINQTITDYNNLLRNAKVQLGDSRLLIFISSSIPKKAIVNLMSQSSSIGAVFVIRGLINGSYVKTYRYFYSLKGDNSIGIMINPTLFKALAVKVVPTFALYNGTTDLLHSACHIAPTYVKVSGEFSVHYALEQLQNSHNADLAQIAANELNILANNNFYRNK